MERRMEMKRLILLCGANGIVKSTASAELMKRLPHSSYIDSDYCRMTNPPIFNEELIRLNYKNILAMMENSFACGEIQNVIFPFGFHGHRKQLFDALLEELRQKGISCELVPVLLYCGEEENVRRARADGRDEERIRRGIRNSRAVYENVDYPRIDVTDMTAEETAEEILKLIGTGNEEETGNAVMGSMG